MHRSRIILEFKKDHQSGLSFRTFETLGLSRKLITTNSFVKEHDFYHPNNIFVFDGTHMPPLSFIHAQYIEPNPEIKAKYELRNWLRQILDI